jgi:hypothetical protein
VESPASTIRKLAFAAVASLAMASALPASAASPNDVPKDGTKMACTVTPLMPGTAYFARCLDLYAGTFVKTANGGYTAAMVCKHMAFGTICPEVINAFVKPGTEFSTASKFSCTVKGSALDDETLRFDCAIE